MATIPTRISWADGEQPNAAKMKSQIAHPLDFFLATPFVHLTNSATQTLTTATATTITFNTEVADVDGMHSTVTNTERITIVTPGLYHVEARLAFANNATGIRQLSLLKNGAVLTFDARLPALVAGGASGHAAISEYVRLVAGDYLSLQGYQSSGGNLTASGAGDTKFQARWVSS